MKTEEKYEREKERKGSEADFISARAGETENSGGHHKPAI